MKPLIALLCAASMMIALGGCAAIDKMLGKDSDTDVQATAVKETAKKPDATKPPPYSGYFAKYDDMKETRTPTGGTSLRWISPDLKKGKYHSIIIDPVGFYPRPPLLAKVSKGRMLEVVQYLAKQAKQEVGRELKIVEQPGPGVLRWDAAITGVKGTGDSASATKNLPVAMIFTDASPATIPPEHGFIVYLESRLLDSQSKKVMAKSVRSGMGGMVADPKTRVTVEEMKPVLNNWVQDACIFVREYIK